MTRVLHLKCHSQFLELKCQGGVNITCKSQPKEYWLQSYWDDGAQVLAPHDKGIIDEVEKVRLKMLNLVQITTQSKSLRKLMIFPDRIKTLSIDPAVIERHKDLKKSFILHYMVQAELLFLKA